MMRRWEVFDPRDGVAVYRVPFAWLAWLLVRFDRRLDYALAGDGWSR